MQGTGAQAGGQKGQSLPQRRRCGLYCPNAQCGKVAICVSGARSPIQASWADMARSIAVTRQVSSVSSFVSVQSRSAILPQASGKRNHLVCVVARRPVEEERQPPGWMAKPITVNGLSQWEAEIHSGRRRRLDRTGPIAGRDFRLPAAADQDAAQSGFDRSRSVNMRSCGARRKHIVSQACRA